MHLRTLNTGLPFSLGCDNGLGVSQSTKNVIGSFLPKRAFDQANIDLSIGSVTNVNCQQTLL